MSRFAIRVSAAALGTICSVGLVGLSQPTPAGAASAGADKTFVTGNGQVNLAEMAIGNIALQRASSQAVRELATKTIADHKAAEAKLKTVASSRGLALPTAPNAQQQSQAAMLKSVAASGFDLTYLQIQVAGHQMSIAATEQELSAGQNPSVISYAKGYLPVAQMHLSMSQADLKALGGTPTGAPAGTGGQAAVNASRPTGTSLGLAAGGVMLLVASGLLVTRRRKASRSA